MTRPVRPARQQATEADLLVLAAAVRRFVSVRLDSPADVDDVVQETLARLWETRWRLERGALLAYAIVVARNLLASAERGRAIHRRHASRLAEQPTTDDPALDVLAGAAGAPREGVGLGAGEPGSRHRGHGGSRRRRRRGPSRAGVAAAEGAAELGTTGAYLRLDPTRLTLR